MTGAEGLTIGAAAIRRRELTGKTGMSALLENKKAFFIAVFASSVSLGQYHIIQAEQANSLQVRRPSLRLPARSLRSSSCYAGFPGAVPFYPWLC